MGLPYIQLTPHGPPQLIGSSSWQSQTCRVWVGIRFRTEPQVRWDWGGWVPGGLYPIM